MPRPTLKSTVFAGRLRGDVRGLLKRTAQTALNRAGFTLVRNETFAALQAKAERPEAAEARAEAAARTAQAAANATQMHPEPEPTPPPPKVIGDPVEINAALDRACERLAMRSVGEAHAICDEVATHLPDHVPPAHFHLMATLDGFLADSVDREIVLCSSRLAHVRFMITQAQSEHLLFTREHMALMVASQTYYDGVIGNERNRNPKRLMRHGRKVFSQSDEDGLIEEVFRRIGTKHKTFIEIGVQSGIESNTTKLLTEGWSGAWIECSANFVSMAKAMFQQFIASGKLRVLHHFVTVESIELVLSQTGLGHEIDLLSLDIDGNDIWVWQAIRSISPRVMIIEYNATYAPPLCNAVPYQRDRIYGGTSYFGASLGALTKIGDEKGYHLVGCSFRGNNAIFVRKDLCADHFQAPFTAEEHFEPIRYPVMAPWGYLPDFGRFVFV